MEIVEKKVYVDAKTKKQIQRRRRRKRAAVFAVCFLIIAALVFIVLCYTVLFPVKTITVKGNITYSAEQIIEESGIRLGDKLFAISQNKANRTLTTQLPYIKSVKINRTLFDVVELQITETDAVFCYSSAGKFFTADADNKILESFVIQPTDTTLLVVSGAENLKAGYTLTLPDNQFELISEVFTKLQESGVSAESIDVSNKNGITAQINGRFMVDFGTSDEFQGKVSHLIGMLKEIDQKNGSNCVGKIDLAAWSNSKREGYFELTGHQ